jgi:hypothetical protein
VMLGHDTQAEKADDAPQPWWGVTL